MADETVGILRVVLTANTAEFGQALAGAESKLVSLEGTARATTATMAGLSRVWQGLIAVVSVRAFVGAASDVLDLTSKLSDLSAKTGITAEALQRMAFVTSQSGVSLEQIATGATRLGRALVEGNSSTVKAVETLGLRLQDLIAMGPEKAFLAIGEAIAKVPNPMERAALATEIFGRAGEQYLPAFTSDMSKLADQAQRSGAILSNDLVAAGDRAGDAFTRLKAAGTAIIGQLFLPLVPAMEVVANWLASNLPLAINTARNAFDGLIRKGLEVQVWLYDLAVSVSTSIRDVPVLGRVWGVAAGDLDTLRGMAQHAKDALNSFNAQGMRPASEATSAAVPQLTRFSDAADKVAASSRRAAQAVGEIKPPVEAFTGLVSRSLAQTGELTRQLEAWARTNSAVLAPSIQQVSAALEEQEPLIAEQILIWSEFPGTVEQSTTQSGNSIVGFFQRVFGGSQELGDNITRIFSAAFTGGGGALGAVKAFATQTLSALFGMIPGVGQWLQAFAGPIVAMLGNLGKKIGDFFRNLFGGPSRDELAGRELVGQFEDEIIAGSEMAQNESERWRQVVVAITEAYAKVGRSAEEAAADAEKLWASSRQGAEASRQVIDEITQKMEEQAEAYGEAGEVSGEAAEEASETAQKAVEKAGQVSEAVIEQIRQALGRLPTDIEINVRGRYRAPEIPGEEAAATVARMADPASSLSSRFMNGVTSSLSGLTSSTTNNASYSVAILNTGGGGSGMDAQRIANEVFRQWPAAFAIDRHGMYRAVELAVADYVRTYGTGRG